MAKGPDVQQGPADVPDLHGQRGAGPQEDHLRVSLSFPCTTQHVGALTLKHTSAKGTLIHLGAAPLNEQGIGV